MDVKQTKAEVNIVLIDLELAPCVCLHGKWVDWTCVTLSAATTCVQAASLVQVPSRHRLLGFLAQRLKQRDRELNGPYATHADMEATQSEDKEAAAPSWSADSECSGRDLATKEGESENSSVQQTEPSLDPADASSTLEKRSGGALGGWLTRLTGAYSVAGKDHIPLWHSDMGLWAHEPIR